MPIHDSATMVCRAKECPGSRESPAHEACEMRQQLERDSPSEHDQAPRLPQESAMARIDAGGKPHAERSAPQPNERSDGIDDSHDHSIEQQERDPRVEAAEQPRAVDTLRDQIKAAIEDELKKQEWQELLEAMAEARLKKQEWREAINALLDSVMEQQNWTEFVATQLKKTGWDSTLKVFGETDLREFLEFKLERELKKFRRAPETMRKYSKLMLESIIKEHIEDDAMANFNLQTKEVHSAEGGMLAIDARIQVAVKLFNSDSSRDRDEVRAAQLEPTVMEPSIGLLKETMLRELDEAVKELRKRVVESIKDLENGTAALRAVKHVMAKWYERLSSDMDSETAHMQSE